MYLISWLVFFSLWAIFLRYGLRIRVAFLAAHVVNAVLIVLVTETLSSFQALTQWPLVAFWSIILLLNLVWLYCLRNRRPAEFPSVPFDAIEMVILIAIGLIVVVTGVIALVAPPNNYDSMVYHMARVAHWAYNATVANYPTNTLKQLVYPPYSEFAILQAYIMGGTDHFANLVQWNSMVASLVGISLIAEMLGGARRAQLFAVLFAATLPMGIMQASSTQNDYVATFWAVCVAVFAVLLITTGKRRWGILGALSFGLVFFTKGIAVIVSAPFVIWAIFRVDWKVGHKIILGLFGILTVLAINGAFLYRLTELSPNPYKAMMLAGEDARESAVVVQNVDIRGMISNMLRGAATELVTPFPVCNRLLLQGILVIHHWMGIGINDPRFTFILSKFSLCDYPTLDEDLITSWIHSIVYLLVIVYIVFFAFQRILQKMTRAYSVKSVVFPNEKGVGTWKQSEVFKYFVVMFIVAVFVFCAFFKWQEWIPRFHLPFFVIFSAVAGVVVDSSFVRPRISLPVGAMMFIAATLPLFFNPQRSVFPCEAVTKNSLELRVARGGEIFDWLMKNGYFKEKSGNTGYLNDITDDMRERLRQAYPVEYEQVWTVLGQALSFSRGIFFTSRDEMLFGRFSKFARDAIAYDVRFMRRQLNMSPECRDIGLIVDMEYPFWSLLHVDGRPIRVESIVINNVSKKFPYPGGELKPCFILKEGKIDPDTIVYHGQNYLRCSPGPIQVYVDERHAPAECSGNILKKLK